MTKKIIIGLIVLLIVIFGWVGISKLVLNKESGAGSEDATQADLLENEEFSIVIPEGWREEQAPMGANAMVVAENEAIVDPAAAKINFTSYFSVSYDTLQGQTEEAYMELLKSNLQQMIPSASFVNEQQIAIDEKDASMIEIEINQQGVDFKVLIVEVRGVDDDVWLVSFNTTKVAWDSYQDLFYETAGSFRVK